MHAAIGHKSLQRFNGHGLAHAVKATNGDHARRVINKNIHASGALKGANVATFAANDATLKIIRWNLYGAHRGIRGGFTAVALHGHQRDLTRALAGFQFRLFNDLVL